MSVTFSMLLQLTSFIQFQHDVPVLLSHSFLFLLLLVLLFSTYHLSIYTSVRKVLGNSASPIYSSLFSSSSHTIVTRIPKFLKMWLTSFLTSTCTRTKSPTHWIIRPVDVRKIYVWERSEGKGHQQCIATRDWLWEWEASRNQLPHKQNVSCHPLTLLLTESHRVQSTW